MCQGFPRFCFKAQPTFGFLFGHAKSFQHRPSPLDILYVQQKCLILTQPQVIRFGAQTTGSIMEKGYFIMDKAQSSRGRNDSDSVSHIAPTTAIHNKPQSLPIPYLPPPSYSDYLTPSPETPLTHAQPPQLPAFPAEGFSRSPQSSVVSRDGRERELPRADSGIEADFRRGPLSSCSSANPRSSTIYESIDAAGNVYTDPSPAACERGRSTEGETSSSGVSSLPPTSSSTPHGAPSDSEDGVDDNVRRRLPPVYSPLNESTPQLYTETCLCGRLRRKKKKEEAGEEKEDGGGAHPFCLRSHSAARHVRYLWCGLLLLATITLLLLALLSYVFVVLIPGLQAHIRRQENDIRTMGSDYRNLSHKVDALLWQSAVNQTSLPLAQTAHAGEEEEDGVVRKAVMAVRELNASVQGFESRLLQLNDRLQLQIDNISRVSDLTGVSGVGDLNACYYQNFTSTQALPGPPSATAWVPASGSDQFRNDMVLSVTCGVQGGTLHLVEARGLPEEGRQHVQYRCRCAGHLPGHDRRVCRIHMVLCPRRLPLHLSAAAAAAERG